VGQYLLLATSKLLQLKRDISIVCRTCLRICSLLTVVFEKSAFCTWRIEGRHLTLRCASNGFSRELLRSSSMLCASIALCRASRPMECKKGRVVYVVERLFRYSNYVSASLEPPRLQAANLSLLFTKTYRPPQETTYEMLFCCLQKALCAKRRLSSKIWKPNLYQ
jgi:hypothetical protein